MSVGINIMSENRTEKYYQENKDLWEKWTKAHIDSDFYNVKCFLKGKSSLQSIEIKELGDVKGKSLLHLQCHFGMDTLSWARKGAIVTGMDISEESINFARELAQKCNLKADFIQSGLYDLPKNLKGKFDIIVATYGTIYWLDDMKKWAKIIDHFLKPGGTFLFIEFHPVLRMFDFQNFDWEIRFPYFYDKKPMSQFTNNSYASNSTELGTMYSWSHSLSEVMSAILSVGLEIKKFKEYDYSVRKHCMAMGKINSRKFVPKDKNYNLPFMYLIRAQKQISK